MGRLGTVKYCVLCLVAILAAGLPSAGSASAKSWQGLVTDASFGSDSATPFDTGTNVLGSPVSGIGSAGLGVAVSPDARTAYVVAANSQQLTPVDLTSNPPVARPTIPMPHTPARGVNFVAIAPNGKKAYVSDPANDQVLPIDLTSSPATAGTPINVGAQPEGIAFSPDGTTLYVADSADPPTGGTPNILPITVATDTPGTPITGPWTNPFWISITPDGSKAYVADIAGGKVYPISLPARTVGSAITVGAGPRGIALTPNGATAYVANGGSGSVTPITVATNKAGSPITVGGSPFGIAVRPDGKTVYVTDGANAGSTVIPIDTATNKAGSPIAGFGVPPRGIAITPDQAPVANFTVTSAPPGSSTTFDASSSTVSYGTITRYDWTFGDGTVLPNGGPKPSHVYASTGAFTATVTETDSAGTSTTGEIFTGQTASSVGNPSANAKASVIITNAPAPAVTLSASTLNFGTIGVGKPSAARTLTITNGGKGALTISTSALSGSAAADFKLSADTCTGHTIVAASNCTVSVTFTPSAAGGRSARLAFSDNASGSPHTISLTGTGTSMGSLAGRVRAVTAPGAASVPLPGATVLVCHPNFVGCFTMSDQADGSYRTGPLTPGPYHVELYPPNGSPLLSFATNAIVDAGAPTNVSAILRPPRPFRRGIVIRTGLGKRGGVPTVYLNSPASFLWPIGLLPGSEFGPPSPCFLSLETVTLSGSTAAGVNGGKSYQFSATQKIALDYPGPGALTFSTAQNGFLLNPAAAGKPATIVISQKVGRAQITWTLVAGSGRGGGEIYAGLLISVSGMQDVFGKHGADLHGNISIDLHGSNAWSCKIKGGGDGDSGGDLMIDPSGYVHTGRSNLPVPGARVTLERQGPGGVFSAPLSGQNSIFSPALNPEHTDSLGHYGWNVVPGRYRVKVHRHGCRSKTSALVTVPPPVTTLDVKLRCHGFSRAGTTLTAKLVGKAHASAGVVLAVKLHTRKRSGIAGYITVRAAHQRYTVPIGGTKTTIGIPDLRAGRHRVAISYSGDGYRKPGRGRLIVLVRR